ncbi:MAG: outer membrane beta-barrel protein [Gammaproteobacteria bacterium]|jgi:hypothetical protein
MMRITGIRTLSVLALSLGALGAGGASAEVSYSYVEADFINVDSDVSSRIEDVDTSARLDTDDDYGFRIAGAWQVYGNWHLFGEYSKAKNDISFSGTVLGTRINSSGDFDVVRWRAGAGYGYPLNEVVDVYGRLSYDYIEFDSVDLSGVSQSLDTDDSGIGGELGLRFKPFEPVELYTYARYTDVGEVDLGSNNSFDDDTLFGFGARFSFTDMIGVQAGYEVGKIDTWGVGARLTF